MSVTLDDVRQIASRLPGVVEGDPSRFALSIRDGKGIAWAWLERVHPKKARVPNHSVLAVVTPGLEAKEMLLAAHPDALFTEPHYNGFPAVLVRLDIVDPSLMEDLLIEAWRCKAPKRLLAEYDR